MIDAGRKNRITLIVYDPQPNKKLIFWIELILILIYVNPIDLTHAHYC